MEQQDSLSPSPVRQRAADESPSKDDGTKRRSADTKAKWRLAQELAQKQEELDEKDRLAHKGMSQS